MRQGERVGIRDDQSGHSKLNNFSDKTWGEKARQLVKTTIRLEDSHWAMIKAFASTFSGDIETDNEGGDGISWDDDDPVSNPHAFITLDWYVTALVSIMVSDAPDNRTKVPRT